MADKSEPAGEAETKAENAAVEAKKPNDDGVLYREVTVLNADQHASLRVAPAKNVKFAAGLNSIRLAASELPQAATSYPVVFAETKDGWCAYAVTGHASGKNEFIDDAGKWREGCYIPAFVRRYPFILAVDNEKKTYSLAADMTSELLNEEEGAPLFEGSKPSQAGMNALKFCTSLHEQLQASSAIIKQIADTGILQSRRAEFTKPDRSRHVIEGFNTVDEAKLRELPDDKFLELRKSGALNLVYCQLWSMRTWNSVT